jgi:TetR/AcrR family transcriptional regulator, cholesterol catabolism regulator
MSRASPTPAPPREYQDKLRHILAHAARVFSEKGFEGASIRDLSRASGVSLSGLYYYFKSKQQLLYLIQINAFKRILASLEERLEGIENTEQRLRILIHNHVDYFLRHPVEMKVMAHEEDALDEPYRTEAIAIKRRYYQIARQIFDGLQGSHSGRRLNPRVAVLSLFGMMNWVYKWHNSKVDPPADALGDAIAGIFLNGISGQRSRDRQLAATAKRETSTTHLRATG